jgi:2-dehydro-3-deoxyphosphogluconate aldolase / (4S)-4-hydroxy-2-oxoglutarate aldolase
MTRLNEQKIIPVCTIKNQKDATPLARSLLQAGLTTIEVTLRSPCALEAIESIRREFPQMHIGAGTIINTQQLEDCYNAGVDFAVSPGFLPAIAQTASIYSIDYLPGIATISEAMQAYELGFKKLKVYPAMLVGGVEFIKCLGSVLPKLQLCPTGGIDQHNIKDFLCLKNVYAVGTSSITPADLVEKQDWHQITNTVHTYRSLTV